MDNADQAQHMEQWHRELALRRAHSNHTIDTHGTGECWYCQAPLIEPERRWCDADCRDDWQREQEHENN